MNVYNNSRTTNFNLFAISDGSCEAPSDHNHYANLLSYALHEVEINTPDSIALAVKILEQAGINVPELIALNQLQHQGKLRDASFADEIEKMKEAAKISIQTLLNKQN